MSEDQLPIWNAQLKGIPPQEIIAWAIQHGNKPVVTTNFRPYEVALLHAVTDVDADIPVIFVIALDLNQCPHPAVLHPCRKTYF